MLKVGDKAPQFKLESDTDGEVSLSDFKGKKTVVLYFYPKDNTPGCNREACAFQESLKKYQKLDVEIVGVSPDKISSHVKFREKFGLKFKLLSDEGHKLAEKYKVWVEKKNYGKTYMGVQRSTFIIDKDGVIAHIWPKVSVDGHDAEVLEVLKSL